MAGGALLGAALQLADEHLRSQNERFGAVRLNFGDGVEDGLGLVEAVHFNVAARGLQHAVKQAVEVDG